MGMELLFLLLPVAALSGWLLGYKKRSRSKKTKLGCPPLSSEYFKGLNFLLNEQPDEALEVFIRMSEEDSETVDIQFALASLFLRRGEVDRAIRIHQNLIARPMLSQEQRKHALYELGLDYMRAGLLDRAESLFQELTDNSRYARLSQRQLLDIYQQEKEWQKAIDIASKLNGRGDRTFSPVIAHYYCELAEKAFNTGEFAEASRLIKRAFAEDKNCVRASLLEGTISERLNQPKQAIRAYRRIEQQDAEYLPLVIEPLKRCYEASGQMDEYTRYLQQLSDKDESITLSLALSRQLCEQGDERTAMDKMLAYLQRRPSLRALDYLLELRKRYNTSEHDTELSTLSGVIHNLLEAKPVYRCGHCGFTSRSMLWQCPSCKQWGRIKPIQGIEGE